MESFWKAAAVVLLTIILGAAIGKTEKDISASLSVAACCAILMVAVQYLSEVVGFLWKLRHIGSYQNPFLEAMLKIAGVSLTTELTGLISSDAGCSSLGKVMQILGNAVILFLSLPVMEALYTMIQEIVDFL